MMVVYLLAMVGGLTIISAIMMLFAYMLTTLEKEGRR